MRKNSFWSALSYLDDDDGEGSRTWFMMIIGGCLWCLIRNETKVWREVEIRDGKFDCSTQLSALGCALTQGRLCRESLRPKFNFYYNTSKYSYLTRRHLYGSMLVWGKKLVVVKGTNLLLCFSVFQNRPSVLWPRLYARLPWISVGTIRELNEHLLLYNWLSNQSWKFKIVQNIDFLLFLQSPPRDHETSNPHWPWLFGLQILTSHCLSVERIWWHLWLIVVCWISTRPSPTFVQWL